MRIGIDVDGVIADNHTAWINRINDAHGKAYTPADLTCWEFWTDLGVTKAELFAQWTPDIYEDVAPYAGALNTLCQLRELGHEVVYITSCFREVEWTAKRAWLKRYGFLDVPEAEAYAVGEWAALKTKEDAANKMHVDWLVDDSTQNCEMWPGYALLLTRPHNRNLQCRCKRIRELEDVVLLLKHQAEREEVPPAVPVAFQTADKSHIPQGSATTAASPLPTDKQARKDTPLTSGVLDYFPAALAYVARVSKAGNDQHNPGKPLHWAFGKSMDHADCVGRHLVERGTIDTDNLRHSGKLAWRALALLQQELMEQEGAPLPRAARLSDGA